MKTRAFRQSRPYSRRRPVPFSVPCSLAVGAVFLASGPIAAATGPEIRAEIVEPARLRISWSDASRGFGLETTADLSPGVDWAVVEEVVAGPGDGWSVTLPLNERERYFRLREGAVPALASLIRTSPRNGEAGVSVNRETILEFSRALAADAVVDAGNFRARFGGRSLLSRVELSPDRRRATLFPLEPFPAGSRLQISLVGDGLRDDLGREVDADGDGFPGGTARLEFDTMSAAALPGTAVTGHVYASDPEPVGGAFANRPLEGVLVTVDGAEETLRTITDADGFFRLEPCPTGRFFVHIDGRMAVGSDWPDGAYYPYVGKTFEAEAGRRDNLAGGTGEIFLPLIAAGTLQAVQATGPTTVTFPAAVLTANPELAGVSLTVPTNALFADDGTRGGRLGLAPVPPDRIPSPLPPGLEFPLVITIQTDGPANFDRPAPVRFPNLPDPRTGEVLPPGSRTQLWSFNHDTGNWEPQGSMTVSADGRFVDTDPGVGVRQPGWHGVNPATPPVFPSAPADPKACDPLELLQSWFEVQKAEFDCLLKFDIFSPAMKLFLSGLSKGTDLVVNLTQTASALANGESTAAVGNAYQAARNVMDLMKLSMEEAKQQNPVARAYDITKCLVKIFKESTQFGCDLGRCLPGTAAQKAVQQDVCAEVAAAIAEFERLTKGIDFTIADRWGKLLAAMDEAAALLASSGGGARALAAELAPEARAALQAKIEEALALARELEAAYQPSLELDTAAETVRLAWQQYLEVLLGPARSSFSGYAGVPYRLAYPGFDFRGRSTALGAFEFPAMAPEVDYTFSLYVHGLNVVAETSGRSAGAGEVTRIPDPRLKVPGLNDLSGDADGDGLTDLAEGVLGTRVDLADTDGDGRSDFAEVSQGEDPLSGLSLPVGIVASVPLPGDAHQVRHAGGFAYVATGEHGLAIVDVRQPETPVLAAALDLPGRSFTVAVDPMTRTALLAAAATVFNGPDEGLHFVDLSVPEEPFLRATRHVPVRDIAAADGLGFAGLERQVRIYENRTGLEVGWTATQNELLGLTVEAGHLYVATTRGLEIYGVDRPAPVRLGGVDLDVVLVGRTEAGGDMVVTGGILHAGAGNGYVTLDVSDPANPHLLAQSTQAFPPILHSLSLNGSGLMLGLISFGASSRDLAVFDASDPLQVDRFLFSLASLDVARGLDLAGGLALVADLGAGLTVINPRGLDANGLPPAVTVDLAPLDADPGRDGLQVQAGSRLSVRAHVQDDVQMREAALIVDGVTVATRDRGPVDFAWSVPAAAPENPVVVVEVQAVDTGGNRGTSGAFPVEILPDPAPPSLVASLPADRRATYAGESLVFRFDEPLQPVTNDPASIVIVRTGPDGEPVGEDHVTVARAEVYGATLVLTLEAALDPGAWQLTIPAEWLADNAGNVPGSDVSLAFRSFATPPDVAVWIASEDGRFDAAGNWLAGRVPDAEPVLLPENPAQTEVAVRTRDILLRSLESALPLLVGPGGEIEIQQGWQARAPVVVSNAPVYLDGDSRFEAPVRVTGGTLQSYDAAITFTDSLVLERGGGLVLDGAAASVAFDGGIEAVNFGLTARDGAMVALPQLQACTGLGDFTTVPRAGTRFNASGAGSRIELPNLASVVGPVDADVLGAPAIEFDAMLGGVVEAPRLTSAEGRVSLRALGSGSRVAMPALEALNGPPSGPVSGIEVAAGGEVLLGAMPALAVCEVRLSAPGSLRGGILTFTPTAVLRGAGTVDADVLHRGAIRLDQASGPLIITGGLELAAGATLEAVIGLGPERGEAGHFDVAGDVVLGGTLKLAQASGYLPAAGDQFVIGVTAGTFSGAFAQVDDSALDAGLRAAWSAVDGELTVRLMAAP